MWIEIVCTGDALAGLWLPWEQLRAGGKWPGVFATAAGFGWLLRHGREAARPWVLACWQGRRLAGLLPLLAIADGGDAPEELHLPPLVQVPLGSQPTVFLLEVFQSWQRVGGQASGICGCWPWAGERPLGGWAVAARWRHWTLQPQQPAWVMLPGEELVPGNAGSGVQPPSAELSFALADSFLPDWDEACWEGWSPGLTRDPLAWWKLAELLQRHRRLLVVRLRPGTARSAWLLAAQEPPGVVLLARAGFHFHPGLLLKVLWQVGNAWQGSPSSWIVPARWLVPLGASQGNVWYHWRALPPRAPWQNWLDRLRPGFVRPNKKRRPVSEPAG